MGIYLLGGNVLGKAGGGVWSSASGGGGGSAPFILYTDITAGPVTGGENSKGCYLSIYGTNFGNFSDYGTTNFVTIGGVNVDNYRCLTNTVNAKLNALGVKRLTVQVGALTGLSAGTAYAVSVTVGGTSPGNSTSSGKYVDLFAEVITFTPQPGSIIFVDKDSIGGTANNANAGTITSPKLELQNSGGKSGALPWNGANVSDNAGEDGAKPGTHVILRAGTYSATGLNNRWVDLYKITGRPATGATDRGPIVVTSYPGAAGANSPEVVAWVGSGDNGGFNGNDGNNATASVTAYGGGGTIGWCQYIQISNLKVNPAAAAGSDRAPFNTQNHGQYWRIINCEATWPSTVSTTSQGRSAGIEGSPVNGRFYGNYIHDIYGAGSEADTQHGFYMDGFDTGSGNVANGNILAFNYIYNMTFGNGIQFYDGANGAGMRNNTVAYNWIKTTSKHGLNISNNTQGVVAYNNVIEDAGVDGIHMQSIAPTVANEITVTNNTIYGWGRVSGQFAVRNEATVTSGRVRIENNIFMQTPSHSANGYDFDSLAGGEVLNDNQWYDPDGRLTTKPAGDSAGAYGNPLFTNAATGDFTLQLASPCVDTGSSPSGVTRSYGFALNAAPVNSTHDRGAYERTT
jgi:hypothetical protein